MLGILCCVSQSIAAACCRCLAAAAAAAAGYNARRVPGAACTFPTSSKGQGTAVREVHCLMSPDGYEEVDQS
jgi:hypothetical protein